MKKSLLVGATMSVAISALLSSCYVPVGPYYGGPGVAAVGPYYGGPVVANVGFGFWNTVPVGYVGETYYLNGRHYYGGFAESGRFYDHGHCYSSRYRANGHYYYGGNLVRHHR
jgi:hypothetical protein